MRYRRVLIGIALTVSILSNLILMPSSAILVAAAGASMADIVDDFESGLPSGVDGNGIPIGFYT
jgi:hypothetical protein